MHRRVTFVVAVAAVLVVGGLAAVWLGAGGPAKSGTTTLQLQTSP